MNSFLSRQYPNFILWAPFIMATGAVAYFNWPNEPVITAPFLIAGLCAAAFIFVTRSFNRGKIDIIYYAALAVFLLIGFGFFWSAAFTRNLGTPTIPRDLRSIAVIGTVDKIDYTADRTRVYVRIGANADTGPPYGGADDIRPYKTGTVVRLSLKSDEPIPKIGDSIRTVATLFKPSPADVPGAFDMAEFAYFRGFGATGYPTKELTINNEQLTKNSLSVSNFRDKIHARIAAHENETATALTDSLVLGHGRAIDREQSNAARAAGIAHVFSISGFHLTLIGGWFFAFFYLLARAVAPFVRRFPARIPALICTWVALLFYLSISGAMAATQRSFIMATLGFAALMFSRTIISLRNVCLVFGILILFNPHYVMEIGFQLSFAAIFGLTYFFSGRKYADLSRMQKIARGIRNAILATVAATIFTEPLIAYHFHSVQIYTLLGNLICVPLFSILIMPLVIVGTITGAGFGWFLPLDLGAHAYDLVMRVTGAIASLPHSMIFVPKISGTVLMLWLAAAAIFLFTFRESRREKFITGAIVAGILLVSAIFLTASQRPVFYASRDHELVAFMTDDGKLQFNKASSAGNKMSFDTWDALNGDGQTTIVPVKRKPIGRGFDGEKYGVDCAEKVCTYTTPDWTLAYVQQFVPLYRNIEKLCDVAAPDFIATYFKIDAKNCGAKIITGGFVMYEDGHIERAPSNRIWHK